MEMKDKLEAQIAAEWQRQKAFAAKDLLAMAKSGQAEAAADRLIFFSQPAEFAAQMQPLRERLDGQFSRDAQARPGFIAFLSHVTLGLGSHMVRWNLQNAALHGQGVLSGPQVRAEVETNLAMLSRWEAAAPDVAAALLAEWRQTAQARLQAEKAADPAAQAEALAGRSLVACLRNTMAAVAASKLRQVAEMRADGLTATELGNDYAAFLKYTMYLGCSFVTTNPVLVDIAWNEDPAYWDPVMEQVVSTHPEASDEALARMATLEVVLANMLLLRPIFLITRGAMGCVSLQVNPKRHGDAPSMVEDVTAIYAELRARLHGGVPNVVFKLPATWAGLQAAKAITAKAIGVNITVNFGLFQLLAFAWALDDGKMMFSTLSEMNGRLAYPVRDELLAKLPELKKHGVSEADVREAAAWAGVAVLKRLHQLMDARGLDLGRIRPLVASLRIYKEGPGHDRLPSAYPDVTETVGTRIITVFPNVRHALDNEAELTLNPNQVDEAVPENVLQVLTHSEIFKQAYYVADREWLKEEDERFRPDYVLELQDEAAVADWKPVAATLGEFAQSYDRFVAKLVARRKKA